MNSRRKFILKSFLGATGLSALAGKLPLFAQIRKPLSAIKPIVISTWNHGLAANEAAWQVLNAKGRALDAVETGVKVTEADPKVTTVGYGGYPDREGKVTLDACIMDEEGNCGSVAFLQNIKHPISVARLVMEKTPHVFMVGEGAQRLALAHGFKKENLLTPQAAKAWKEWLKTSKYKPVINAENHDTISMLAIDAQGNMSGACTTSGAAWKMHGRIGDSPIIGAALFVDNEVGGACATGLGEAVIKMVGSHLVVELMRQGLSPQDACRAAVERIVKKQKNYKELQVGFLAMNKAGETGAYSVQPGFNYAVHNGQENKLIDAQSMVK
ncbi:isoaspartyl peptidase/L-asparaginase family protein [Adhaeribacter aerolatus]|nr:N(4)-(beta-N-acetylglucosaminyl)-L-asparaginase [Adhaeribacter aerolatus]